MTILCININVKVSYISHVLHIDIFDQLNKEVFIILQSSNFPTSTFVLLYLYTHTHYLGFLVNNNYEW